MSLTLEFGGTDMKTKEIKIPVYYRIAGRKGIIIDEDSMREEFEFKLKKVMAEAKKRKKK